MLLVLLCFVVSDDDVVADVVVDVAAVVDVADVVVGMVVALLPLLQ